MTQMLLEAPLVLPDLGVEIDGDALGDDILLQAASAEKVQRVKGGRPSAFQSHQARAWTRGGNVD